MRTKPKRVVIVGAGLFGSIAAHLCMLEGYDVTIIDSNEKESGSAPAACLMKPSWMSGLGKRMEIGMNVLNKLYPVKNIRFTVNGLKDTDVSWVPPHRILQFKPIKEKVISISDGLVVTEKGEYEGFVLCAAGVWSFELLNYTNSEMKSLTGAALLSKGKVDPEIRIWAPYKQAVWFNRKPNEIWFGDGTSILRKNYGSGHIDKSIERAAGYGLMGPNKLVVGQRPYIKGHKGYFRRVHDKTWISTGGAKNGTVLAAYQAYQFLEAINDY